jgi:hypothetical protein
VRMCGWMNGCEGVKASNFRILSIGISLKGLLMHEERERDKGASHFEKAG